ncbi:MAG: alpha/beta hydrolase [Candidatus Glassbacteria bacterium]
MKSQVLHRSMLSGWLMFSAAAVFFHGAAFAQTESPSVDTVAFTVQTYDGLELPAQVIRPAGPTSKMILFINGATPYDEKGNQWAGWDENGRLLKFKQDFYARFLDIMPAKGYGVATLAKRSFVYSHNLPRPNLDELALDLHSFVIQLQERELLGNIGDLVIVGYSEGSIVATKVLGLLKKQPAACVLLGSGSLAFDYRNQTWDQWFMVDILRRDKGCTDEQIKKEYSEWSTMMNDLLTIDEETWENQWRKHPPFGFGLAPWESYYVDRELIFYNPTPNLLEANVPVLICIGQNDTAMPMVLARRTYDNLLKRGFQKAVFRVIDGEVHQYKKYDVFAVIDSWLESGGKTADFTLGPEDSVNLEKYAKLGDIKDSIAELSWEGGEPEKALACFRKARDGGLQDPNQWFNLGVKLFANGGYDQSLYSFSQASDTSFDVCFASMVWMGHLNDLLHRREEALTWYEKGLEHYLFPITHSQWNLTIDRTWIEERLKNPFIGVK